MNYSSETGATGGTSRNDSALSSPEVAPPFPRRLREGGLTYIVLHQSMGQERPHPVAQNATRVGQPPNFKIRKIVAPSNVIAILAWAYGLSVQFSFDRALHLAVL